MSYKVFALFPTAEYEVESYLEVIKLKRKKHGIIWMYAQNIVGFKDGEIFIIHSTNAYYTYIIQTEYRINNLNVELQVIQKSINEELQYANKLIKNFYINSDKNTNIYMNGSTSVIVVYQPRGRKYTITCNRTREKKIRLTVNVLTNIELLILRLLFELPIIESEYVINHNNRNNIPTNSGDDMEKETPK